MISTNEFELLLEATKTINSTLEINELLTMVMDLAKQVVKAEAASLLLVDKPKNELVFDVALGEKGEKVKSIRLKIGEGIAGWVAQNAKPLLVENVAEDKRWFANADKISEFKTRSIICVPLIYKDEVIGVIEAINRVDRPSFLERDIPIFQAFAAQVAVAVKNAQLFSSLGAEKEKIVAVLSGMREGAIAVDINDVIVMSNQSSCQYLADNCLEGKNFFNLVKDFEITPNIHSFSELTTPEFNIELSRKSGKTLYLSVHGHRIVEDGRSFTGSIMVIRDVTTERTEERLKRTFLSLVSHKLKTPLTTISGYIPLLLTTEINAFQKKSLLTMKQQSSHLISLVEKLLNFTLIEAEVLELEPKPTNLIDLVYEAKMFHSSIIEQKNVLLEVDDSVHKCPKLFIDSMKTTEAIKNLLENAIKFSNKPQPVINISVSELTPAYAQIVVSDNGPGIPSEEHQRIFDKFYQVEESFTGQVEGFGLGLALVKRVIEAQNGKVWVQSKIDQGTKIFFELPISKFG